MGELLIIQARMIMWGYGQTRSGRYLRAFHEAGYGAVVLQ